MWCGAGWGIRWIVSLSGFVEGDSGTRRTGGAQRIEAGNSSTCWKARVPESVSLELRPIPLSPVNPACRISFSPFWSLDAEPAPRNFISVYLSKGFSRRENEGRCRRHALTTWNLVPGPRPFRLDSENSTPNILWHLSGYFRISWRMSIFKQFCDEPRNSAW